jgi:hypothetical protein
MVGVEIVLIYLNTHKDLKGVSFSKVRVDESALGSKEEITRRVKLLAGFELALRVALSGCANKQPGKD